MSVKFLKVKVKALMAEAQIIRREEQKLKGQDNDSLRGQLHQHRTGVVRKAARETQLAYGYLRGRTYAQIEPKVDEKNAPDWSAVGKMVKKYGWPHFERQNVEQLLAAWEDGQQPLKMAS